MPALVIPSVRVSTRDRLRFYEEAFGAVVVFATPADDDTLDHAQVTIGGGMFMCGTGLSDGLEQPVGGSSVYWVLAEDAEVDAIHARALAAGATDARVPYDADYGGRHCTVLDPDGNSFSFGTYRPEGV